MVHAYAGSSKESLGPCSHRKIFEVICTEFASEAGFDNAFQYSDLQQCKSLQARLNENVTLDVVCWS